MGGWGGGGGRGCGRGDGGGCCLCGPCGNNSDKNEVSLPDGFSRKDWTSSLGHLSFSTSEQPPLIRTRNIKCIASDGPPELCKQSAEDGNGK